MTTLFALGKAAHAMPTRTTSIAGTKVPSPPLLRSFYERKAPKMVAKHTVNMEFSPISILYHGAALEGLLSFFEGTYPDGQQQQQNSAVDPTTGYGTDSYQTDLISTMIVAKVKVPRVSLELRNDFPLAAEERREEGGAGNAFACLHLEDLQLVARKTEEYRMELELDLSAFQVEDLLEGDKAPRLKYILKTSGDHAALSQQNPFLSNSCPDLSLDKDANAGETPASLPGTFSPVPPPARDSTAPAMIRRGSCHDMDDNADPVGLCSVRVSLVHPTHPKFLSAYSGVGYTIRTRLTDVEVNVNQQTVVLLLDFLGLIGPPLAPVNPASSDTRPMDRKEIHFEARDLRLNMNRSLDAVCLGQIALTHVQALIQTDEIGLRINGSADSFLLTDTTVPYSQLYSDRLAVHREAGKRASLLSRPDPHLYREYDMSVEIGMPRAVYVHTQRFLTDFINYWLYFFQLMDLLTRMKTAVAGHETAEEPGHGVRVQLKVEVEQGVQLTLPVNSLCKDALVVHMDALAVDNAFLFASQKIDNADAASASDNEEDTVDCLLDVMHVACRGVKVYQGSRVEKGKPLPAGQVESATLREFAVARDVNSATRAPFDLSIVVERNLDAAVSHRVPDLAIFTQVSKVQAHITTDAWKLIRGVLDHNLGEELPPVVSAPEFRQNPQNVTVLSGRVYTGLSFHAEITDLQLDCYSPAVAGVPGTSAIPVGVGAKWTPMGEIHLKHARLSYESFSDHSRELDLICHQTSVLDSRFEDTPANKRPNVFGTLVSSCRTRPPTEGDLLAEMHFLARKDTPAAFTVVLSEARMMVLPDWLLLAMDFITANNAFRPPVLTMTRPQSATTVHTSAPGVLTRRISLETPKETDMELRLNLRDCEFVFLEDPSSKSSPALILKLTAVMHSRLSGGVPALNVDAQSAELNSCVMSQLTDSLVAITDPFHFAIDLAVDELKRQKLPSILRPGLLYTEAKDSVTHRLEVKLYSPLMRLSYRDWLMCEAVARGYYRAFLAEDPLIPTEAKKRRKTSDARGSFLINRISLKCDSVALWFLDDFQDCRFPLLRVGCRNVELDHNPLADPPEGQGSLTFYSDYFNQRVYAWEPFVEPWLVSLVAWTFNPKEKLDLNLMSDEQSTLDVTWTQCFLQQLMQFFRRWPTVQSSLTSDFRQGSARSRNDHLPYLLKNDTGLSLMFTTDTQLPSGSHQKIRWNTAAVAESVSFTFPSRQFAWTCEDEAFTPHQVQIRMEGWSDTSAVSVDRIGTYFRLAKPVPSVSASTLSGGAMPARVVIAVSMDQDGKKIVTVRSALTFVNSLSEPLQLKLENLAGFLGDAVELTVPPSASLHAPMRYALCKVEARPRGTWASVHYCRPIVWQDLGRPGQVANLVRVCNADGGQNSADYRMCVCIKREFYPPTEPGKTELPGHTLYFVPPLKVQNLLPVEVTLKLPGYRLHKCIPAGATMALPMVDIQAPMEFGVVTDSVQSAANVILHPGTYTELRHSVKMIDRWMRELFLTSIVTAGRGGSLQLSLSAPYWMVNKTGVPLLVREETSRTEAAGQFEEHELARSMLPLMFSFSSEDVPPQCFVRLGKGTQPDRCPQWSRKFRLEPGITFRALVLTSSVDSAFPEMVYNIGIEVRTGQGLYKNTQVVIFTPRFQLDNRSRFRLMIAQKSDVDKKESVLSISPNCYAAWHWPRQDLDPLLCVRRQDVQFWSCGFRIDSLKSFHLNMRDADYEPKFLRVEIVLHGAMYYVTFSDADALPAPIRVENLTDVPMLYRQHGCNENHHKAMLSRQTCVDYNWDDTVTEPKRLQLTVFDNKSNTYDLSIFGAAEPLLYENFFYIILTASFTPEAAQSKGEAELVLEATTNERVILSKKDNHKETQLWRMTGEGQLSNVGMAQRREMQRREGLVLDVQLVGGIAGVAGSTSMDKIHAYAPLTLARADDNRRKTQRWKFTDDGRLTCGLDGVYVQPADRAMKDGVHIVLGPTQPATQLVSSVPIEQQLERRRQKPGSGQLAVTVVHEASTRVLRITDRAANKKGRSQDLVSSGRERASSSPSSSQGATRILNLTLTINGGLGFSVVNAAPEELMYCRLSGVMLKCSKDRNQYSVNADVMEIQADNQLLSGERWPLLYVRAKCDEASNVMIPALKIELQCIPLATYDAFECFRVQIGKVSLQLEELLLWKTVQFLHSSSSLPPVQISTPTSPSHPGLESTPSLFSPHAGPNLELDRPDPMKARRCYFGCLSVQLRRLYLSVLTAHANSLPPELEHLKRQWNIPLVRFENAPVSVAPFQQDYYFETLDFLMDALQKHFSQELKSQAVRILGTVDFLGNPVGLFQDVSGGLRELIIEGSVSGFVSGVGHGVTNSFAKITSSLSDGVGKIVSDEQHSRLRDSVRQQQHNTGNNPLAHLYSGIKGLGIGIYGGATSLITQTYDGASKEGAPGFVKGLCKGAVGTLTKPVQGVLDLATGAATAVKETVSSGPHKSRFPLQRLRPPRVTRSLAGSLPSYSRDLALAQKTLMAIADGDTREICLNVSVALRDRETAEAVFALVCTERVYFVRQHHDEHRVLLLLHYSQIEKCAVEVVDDPRHPGTPVVVLKIDHKGTPPKSKIKFENRETAEALCRKILFAKQQHDELKRRLPLQEELVDPTTPL